MSSMIVDSPSTDGSGNKPPDEGKELGSFVPETLFAEGHEEKRSESRADMMMVEEEALSGERTKPDDTPMPY